MKLEYLFSILLVVLGSFALATTSVAAGRGGNNKNQAAEEPVDVYLYPDSLFGVIGDGLNISGGPIAAGASRYAPADDPSCIVTFGTIRSDSGSVVKLFLPASGCDHLSTFARSIRVMTGYDLDQDGLCITPYKGGYPYSTGYYAGQDPQSVTCAGPEPDGFEDPMVTMHLDGMLSPLDETGFGSTGVLFQVRIVEYDGSGNIQLVGSQERAFNFWLTNGAQVTQDASDPNIREFVSNDGAAEMCEVVWKNAHSKTCESRNMPENMYIRGVVDATPLLNP